MKPIKNTLLLVNGNIDSTDSYTKTQIGDQSGNFWIESSNTEYSNDTANIDAPDYHKSIKFAENSVCELEDQNHLFNFSDREFSFDAKIKFDDKYKNIQKKHTILSKWSNGDSVTDEKIFRIYYEHIPYVNTNEQVVDVNLTISDNIFEINSEPYNLFSFEAGYKYKIDFTSIYPTHESGLPNQVELFSFESVDETNDEDDIFSYEDDTNVEDEINYETESYYLPGIDYVDETEFVTENSNQILNSKSYDIKDSNIGIISNYISDVEGGILLDLTVCDVPFTFTLKSTVLLVVDDSIPTEDVSYETQFAKMSRRVNIKNDSKNSYGKFVFEFNGNKGYESEIRSIFVNGDVPYYDSLIDMENSEFVSTEFSKLKFKSKQLESLSLNAISKFDPDSSKFYLNKKKGLIVYPKFKDFDLFYEKNREVNSSVDNNVGKQTNAINYSDYLSQKVDRNYMFFPFSKYDITTDEITFKENPLFEESNFTDPDEDKISFVKDFCYGGDSKYCSIVFDYSVSKLHNVILKFYSKNPKNPSKYKYREFRKLDEQIGNHSDDKFGRIHYEFTSTDYIPEKVEVFLLEPGKKWNESKSLTSVILANDAECIIEPYNITKLVSTGIKYEIKTSDLIDGNYHHFYFGKIPLMSADESGHEKLLFGVDGKLTTQTIDYNELTNFPCLQIKTEKIDKIRKLTSIQPFYEAVGGSAPYELFLGVSKVRIGGDYSGENTNLVGLVDYLRVNEFLTFTSESELIEYIESQANPDCWLYLLDANNYCVYDENTDYNLSSRSDLIGVELMGVIRYTDKPTNKFEALKHEMGSEAYFKKYVNNDYDKLDPQEQQKQINDWRWKLKFILPVSETTKTQEDLDKYTEYIDKYLELEVENDIKQ